MCKPSPAIELWFDQQKCDLARHLDPARLSTLKTLNSIVQETFPDDYAQLVPYGSTIYEVPHFCQRTHLVR